MLGRRAESCYETQFSKILMFPKLSLKIPHAGFLRSLTNGVLVVCLMAGFMSVSQAQPASVASLAQAEARRRAIQVNKAADEIARGYQLIDEGKAEEALAVFSVTYEALPNIPLAQEHRLAARNGYVVAGSLHAQELAAKGNLEEANKLIEKLLAPEVAPKDARVLALKARLADPGRFPPALTEKHVANVEAVQILLLKANSFLELGDYDKAISTYQDVLRVDPANSAARRGMERAEQEKQRYYKAAYDQQRSKMLSAVDKTWEDPVPLTAVDVSGMFGVAAESRGNTQSGRETISQKLHSLIFPTVEFAGATLEEVAELLRVRSRDLDPQGKGVNFILNLPPEARGKPISLTLQNVPMEELLRYVSEMCGVTYKVDEHAVTFISLSDRNSAIITRSFRVPPDFIQNAPAGDAAAAPADPFANQASGGAGITIRRMSAKEFLEARGVIFPDGSTATFNAATSTLTVRNTVQNMDMVELLVEQATKAAPKLAVVQVRMIEVNQSNLDELGFDWLLGGNGMNGNNVFVGGGTSGAGTPFSAVNYPFGSTATVPAVFAGAQQVFPAQNINNAVGGPNVVGIAPVNGGGGGPITSGLRSGAYATGLNSLDSLLKTGSTNASPTVAPGILSVAGVFTDPQFQTVLRGLSQKKGVDINASPSVTTKNGLKATVEVTRELIYPTEFDPPQLPQAGGGGIGGGGTSALIATPTTPTAFEMRKTGVELEVEPVIADDGSVELTITPSLTEFEGFVNYGSPINSPNSSNFQILTLGAGGQTIIPILSPERLLTANKILQPIFKSQKVTAGVKIWDGATIVLGGAKVQRHNIVNDQVPILGTLPFIGRLFRSEVKETETKHIIIFVTVDVVDPSGQKINRATAAVTQ
jgi:general secretion pathway protein D